MLLKKREGYVYICHKPDEPYYKIGRTKDPKRRMKQLGCELICAIPFEDNIEMERRVHSCLWSKHVGNEWFDLTEDDILRFDTLQGYEDERTVAFLWG